MTAARGKKKIEAMIDDEMDQKPQMPLRALRLSRIVDRAFTLPTPFGTFCFESAVKSITYKALVEIRFRATLGAR